MKYRIGLGFVALSLLSGCGNADAEKARQLQERVNQLDSEVVMLKSQLEEERNGPPRILGQAKAQIQKGSLTEAHASLEGLIQSYPGSAQALEAATLLQQVEAKLSAEREAQRLAQQRKEAELKAAFAKLDKSLVKKTDDFNGITWVTHRVDPVLANKMALYFGMKDSSAASFPLRLKLKYYGDDWLFVRSVIVKADDQTFDLGRMDFERDNAGGSVWEWSDESMSNFQMLDAVLAAKKVKIRFNGQQYHQDFTLPASQQAAMRDVLLAWERYGGVRR